MFADAASVACSWSHLNKLTVPTDHIGVHVYYGSRTAQPRRVRAFIDLVIERLAGTPAPVLSQKELNQAARDWKRGRRTP